MLILPQLMQKSGVKFFRINLKLHVSISKLDYFFSDCTEPFQVTVVTDATADSATPTAANNGINSYSNCFDGS